MRRRWLRLAVLVVTAVMTLGTVAQAQTVADIVKKGQVSIGILSGAPPYSSVDANGNNVGYHVDVANLIGKYLGVKVNIVPLTNANRVAALESGKIDIQVAQSSPTPERAQAVMFTSPYGGYDMSVFAKNSTVIRSADDLKGKRVSVPRGGVQDIALSGLHIPGLEVVRYDDDATAIQALLSGQADACAQGATIIAMIIKDQPNANLEIKFPLFFQTFSIGTRLDSFQLHQWLNNFIFYVKLSGELDAIHRKWIGVPLPNLPVF